MSMNPDANAVPAVDPADGSGQPGQPVSCGQDNTENLICDGCGNRVSAEHAVSLDGGGTACESCSETCDHCQGVAWAGELALAEVRNRRGGAQQWCRACRQEDSFCCADCFDIFDASSPNSCNDADETVCASCAESYTCCNSCDRTIHTDDHWDGMCNRCHRDREREEEEEERDRERVIHDYGYRPRAKFQGDAKADGGLFFGVELEVEVDDRHDRHEKAKKVQNKLGDFVYLKHDGSLDSGFEIVSHPATLDYHLTAWDEFFGWDRAGLKSASTTTCGLHVHVSRKALTSLQIAKIVCFCAAEQNAEFMKRVAMRGPNVFCKIMKKKLGTAHNHNGDRYQAVNVGPRNTIEFRLFRGTLNKEKFLRCLEFCHALVKFTSPASRSMSDSLDARRFAEFVSANKKTYPRLHTLCAQQHFAE